MNEANDNKKATKLKRALSVSDVLSYRPQTVPITDKWKDAIGLPELKGSWIIYGGSGEGKTSLCMQFGKHLSQIVKHKTKKNEIYYRTAYDSIEEGLSATIQDAYIRTGMSDVAGWFDLLDKESIDELRIRLKMKRSPDVLFIDSVQYTGLTPMQYKAFVNDFPDKLFIWLSHADGLNPKGALAQAIYYDANVCMLVKGFKAFVKKSRYGGSGEIVISETKAREYYEI